MYRREYIFIELGFVNCVSVFYLEIIFLNGFTSILGGRYEAIRVLMRSIVC